ncbi:MAG: hypothetical protein ACI9WU_004241, partial [Myxococcota bacterium]
MAPARHSEREHFFTVLGLLKWKPPRLAGTWCGNDVSTAVERVVHKALEKAPMNRYQTVLALREALLEATSATRVRIKPRARGKLRRP